MAQFCINIADEQIDLVIGSMCGIFGYQVMVANPDPSNHPNPDFDPNQEEGPENLASIPSIIPNPNFNENEPEGIGNMSTIPNPAYNPPQQIPNPETAPQFVNRMVRQWLAENVKAFQAQAAAEAARLAALETTQIEITDPYIS